MFVKLPFWPYHKPLNILLHKLRLSRTLVSVQLGPIQKIKNYFKHLDEEKMEHLYDTVIWNYFANQYCVWG